MKTTKEEIPKKNKKKRTYLDMIVDGKLKDPSPSVIKKISSELGPDVFPKSMDK
jgi:hypothetical protein